MFLCDLNHFYFLLSKPTNCFQPVHASKHLKLARISFIHYRECRICVLFFLRYYCLVIQCISLGYIVSLWFA